MNSTRSGRIHDRISREYSELDQEVRKMTKSDGKGFVDKLADEAGKAASRQDLTSLYTTNKMLNNGLRSGDVPVKDTNGNDLSKEAEKRPRWKEHFEHILNRAEPAQMVAIPQEVEGLVICIDPPSLGQQKCSRRKIRKHLAFRQTYSKRYGKVNRSLRRERRDSL